MSFLHEGSMDLFWQPFSKLGHLVFCDLVCQSVLIPFNQTYWGRVILVSKCMTWSLPLSGDQCALDKQLTKKSKVEVPTTLW